MKAMAEGFLAKTKGFFGLDNDGAYTEVDEYVADDRGNAAVAYRKHEKARFPIEFEAEQPSIVPVDIRSFQHAKKIGEAFRDGDIVVFSVRATPTEEGRRVVDFAAGLAFALYGQIRKLDGRTFALVPKDIDVTLEELNDAAVF